MIAVGVVVCGDTDVVASAVVLATSWFTLKVSLVAQIPSTCDYIFCAQHTVGNMK